MSMRFADFDLWIGNASDATPSAYPLRVFNSPEGPADGEMILDINSPKFRQTLVLAQGDHQLAGQYRQALGKQLFEAVFPGDIGHVWAASLGYAKGNQDCAGLRLRLWIGSSELSQIPWELLWNGQYFLATAPNLAVSRYLPVPEPPVLGPQDQLRILLATASPNDWPERRIPDREIAKFQKQINSLSPEALCTVISNATRHQLHNALLSGYHVLHYLGHGEPGRLLMCHEDGSVDPVSAQALAQLVYGRRELRLVVLNACGSAHPNGIGLFNSVGATLVEKSLPAVVAMQYPVVYLDAATDFNGALYAALVKGYPVDVAVNHARQLMSSKLLARDWSTPVIFLGSRSGRLIDLKSAAVDPVVEAWSTVRKAAAAAQPGARQRAETSLSELATRFADLTAQVRNAERLYQLCLLLSEIEEAYAHCRGAVEGGSDVIARVKVLKPAWQQVTLPLGRLKAFAAAHRVAETTELHSLLEASGRVDESIANLALGELFDLCRSFGDKLACVRATVRQNLSDGFRTVLEVTERTLGSFSDGRL
jgi:hypothetical protein